MTFILSSTGREDSAQLCVYVGGEKVLVTKYLLSVNIKHGRYIETLSGNKNGRFFLDNVIEYHGWMFLETVHSLGGWFVSHCANSCFYFRK